MSSDVVISVEGLGKSYSIYERPYHRLLEILGVGSKGQMFWALQDVSMDVRQGETVGIIGRNGAGKSTLLQIISGTLRPSLGKAEVSGKVAALLELGSGFNPEFSGRENVYLNAALYGLTRSDVDDRMESILSFSEIGEFIDRPIRSYSSGMVMRLAFSVIVHVDASILIIDEALAVGDAFFTQKCMRYLREFKKSGTLLFVSHDTSAVTALCDRAIWLEGGKVRATGKAKDIADAYMEAFIAEREGPRAAARGETNLKSYAPLARDVRGDLLERSNLRNDIRVVDFKPDGEGFGDETGKIRDVVLLDEKGARLNSIVGGEVVTLEIVATTECGNESPIVGFYFKDRLGQFLFGDNTYLVSMENPLGAEAGSTITARFRFQMPRLQAGDYFVTVGLAKGSQEEHVIQHWLHEALLIRAEGQGLPVGILGLPMLDIAMEIEL